MRHAPHFASILIKVRRALVEGREDVYDLRHNRALYFQPIHWCRLSCGSFLKRSDDDRKPMAP